jgi:hypothetical protein
MPAPGEARNLYEPTRRRVAERRERRKVPEWFSVQGLLPEPWDPKPERGV